jgi:chromosome partitioning protein
MPAKIISVCNQKGGCCKTTTTMGAACALAARGMRVLVVNADGQASALAWSCNAPEDAPFPAVVVDLSKAGKALPREIAKMVEDYDIILIDCPPAIDSAVPQAALMISDLALIPLIPSPIDFSATAPFITLVQQVQVVNESLASLVVPSRVDTKTGIHRAFLKMYKDLPLPTAKTRVTRRTSHEKAMIDGGSVASVGDKVAAAEMKALVDEILAAIEGSSAKDVA